jgi:hypothetical protein
MINGVSCSTACGTNVFYGPYYFPGSGYTCSGILGPSNGPLTCSAGTSPASSNYTTPSNCSTCVTATCGGGITCNPLPLAPCSTSGYYCSC